MQVALDIINSDPNVSRKWGAVGLLCNQASVTANLEESWKVFSKVLGPQLKALFGPQHGFVSTVQDNMIETDHAVHGPTGLPIYSLYGETREPTEEMLRGLDTLIVDLQVTGTRVYTYKYSMAACLRAAKKFGKKVVILDRPNPVGGIQVEGPCLQSAVTSFVGEFPIPLRHGLTMGEAGLFFNQTISCELEVVKMKGWEPGKFWDELSRPWVLPSPNLPTPECAYTFPGTVMLEGTNLSEGRGTCLPFLFVGAPYIKNADLFARRIREISQASREAAEFRVTNFQPSFQKWKGMSCRGIQIHVLNPHLLRSFDLGLAIIRAAYEQAPEDFRWIEPGYEYNFKLKPIQMLLGDLDAVKMFTAQDFNCQDAFWHRGVEEYIHLVQPLLLYPRTMNA